MERPLRPGETPGQLSEHLGASALDAGLTKMKRPSRTPNSLKALQTIAYANEHGRGTEVRDALYVAYWEEGFDVGELPVLRGIVEGVGLEWGPLAEALAERRYMDTVLGEYQEAADLGFEGIPAFIIGDVKFTGAQPMALFRQLADRAQKMVEADPQAFTRRRRIL